ncbi:hypothetical protein RUND412_010621, partial [Rhizina undulata]
WFTPSASTSESQGFDLEAFAANLDAVCGGDYPEASKTAIIEILENINAGRKTVVVWYTDAPPHHTSNFELSQFEKNSRLNPVMELKALEKRKGGTEWFDWVVVVPILCNERLNPKHFSEEFRLDDDLRFYILLAEMTGGVALGFSKHVWGGNLARKISKLTVDVLLAWMGRVKNSPEAEVPFSLRFEDKENYSEIKNENEGDEGYLSLPWDKKKRIGRKELKKVIVSEFSDFSLVPKKDGAKGIDLVKKFVVEEGYREIVYKVLKEVVTKDAICISINPLFGELWRAVCKKRSTDERTQLVAAFGDSVWKLSGENKVIMQAFGGELCELT